MAADKPVEKLRDMILHEVAPSLESPHSKVSIVGAGQVGMACAFALLSQQVCSELALVDKNIDKLRGELMDLKHGLAYLRHCHIKASADCSVTANSKITIVTAGSRQREGESRLGLLQRNVEIFRSIIPQLAKYSPKSILMIVSNPVDIMTYVAWKISGFPIHRVFGSGTCLDSSRFRQMLSERIGVAATSVHAYIIGEHGDSSVAIWSTANVSGTRLCELKPQIGTAHDEENYELIHQDVVNSANEIIKLKGYTSWAIGLCASHLAAVSLRNNNSVIPLSTLVRGHFGIDKDVFLSVPCSLGENGIHATLAMRLNDDEKEQLKKSAETLAKVQQQLKI